MTKSQTEIEKMEKGIAQALLAGAKVRDVEESMRCKFLVLFDEGEISGVSITNFY